MNDAAHRTLSLLITVSLLLAGPGCTVKRVPVERVLVEKRWPLEYREVIRVETDPPGAVVVLDGKHQVVSPAEIEVSIGTVTVMETGFADYRVDVLGLSFWEEIEPGSEEVDFFKNPLRAMRSEQRDPVYTEHFVPLDVKSVKPLRPTAWTGPVRFNLPKRVVEFSAAHPGFISKAGSIEISHADEICRAALDDLVLNDQRNLPTEAIGRRTIRLELRRAE